MKEKVIITGANGFTGKYLMRELLQYGFNVIGTWYRSVPAPDNTRNFKWRQIDLTKYEECKDLISTENPDVIVHLAAQNNILVAREEPRQTIRNNILGMTNILEAIRTEKKAIKCILAGSAAVYDTVQEDIRITEEMPVIPKNIYALTKCFQEQLAERYNMDYGMNIICTRPFNYTGYLQEEKCFIPSLCRQVSEIEKRRCKPSLLLGNLSVYRDFLDVRDVVCAYRLLLEDDVPNGIYNISSGNAVRLMNIVNYLCNKIEMKIEININPALVRSDDVSYICGDTTKIREATGWQAEYSIFDTVDWIYERMREEN